MNEMKEAVGNWREAKQFSPADENDFLRWLDKADTWRLAEDLGGMPLVDCILEQSHTCYEGTRGERYPWGYGCGRCPACKLRAHGYEVYLSRYHQK